MTASQGLLALSVLGATFSDVNGFLVAHPRAMGRIPAAPNSIAVPRTRHPATCRTRMAVGDLDIAVSTVMGLESLVKKELEVRRPSPIPPPPARTERLSSLQRRPRQLTLLCSAAISRTSATQGPSQAMAVLSSKRLPRRSRGAT